ncbi:MAG: hypothetical protein ACRELY_33120 [Polyangiaceae bacterium]
MNIHRPTSTCAVRSDLEHGASHRSFFARMATVALAFALAALAACSSDSSGGGTSGGDAGVANGGDGGGSASHDGGSSGGGGDASSGGGNICDQAATKLTGCGLSTGGIESDCTTLNMCYGACIVAATCSELQGPTTDDNAYTQCLSGC